MAVLGLCCCPGFSVAVVKGGHALGAGRGLLIAVVSLVADHGLLGTWASVVVVGVHTPTRLIKGKIAGGKNCVGQKFLGIPWWSSG